MEEALRDKLVIEELKKENLRDFQKRLSRAEQMLIDDTSTITNNYKTPYNNNNNQSDMP